MHCLHFYYFWFLHFFYFKYRLAINAREQYHQHQQAKQSSNTKSKLKELTNGNGITTLNKYDSSSLIQYQDKQQQQQHAKNVFKEIESIKPDYEQRKLAIEVKIIFLNFLISSHMLN